MAWTEKPKSALNEGLELGLTPLVFPVHHQQTERTTQLLAHNRASFEGCWYLFLFSFLGPQGLTLKFPEQ